MHLEWNNGNKFYNQCSEQQATAIQCIWKVTKPSRMVKTSVEKSSLEMQSFCKALEWLMQMVFHLWLFFQVGQEHICL